MTALVTFITPVRHPQNSRNWDGLVARLAQTMESVSAQTCSEWRGVIVANHDARLPPLPANYSLERVGFAPNPLYEKGSAPLEDVYDAVRLDKGRRILKGMLSAPDSRYFMVVDDDDLISNRIVEYVRDNRGRNGWKISRGYLWTDGSSFVLRKDNFDRLCGTSLIVRSDLYDIPGRSEDASDQYVKTMLGSHMMLEGILESRGTPLEELPFPGAVYRVGHAVAHSQSKPLIRSHMLDRRVLSDPVRLARNLRDIRLIKASLRAEFWGRRLSGSRRTAAAP